MGNRRIGRKRLYGVEKQGQSIDLGSGSGISPAIARATQHRQGQELITEILIDLGTSAAAIVPGGADDQIIGVASAASAITQLTEAKFGVITEVRLVCLEDVDASSAAGADINLVGLPGNNSDNATRAQGFDVGSSSPVAIITGGSAPISGDLSAGMDVSYTTDSGALKDTYLYLTDGAGSASGAYNGSGGKGKLAIYIHGFAVPADL